MSTPSSSTDRNLLYGILALQVNFITRDALIAGMNAWVLDKHRSLGEILVEQGALRPDLHDALEVMVRKHLELHDDNAQKSLAAISSVASVRRDLEQLADADVRASVGHISAGAASDADSWRTTDPGVSASLTSVRYKRLRPHARGGLGEVFVALDEELQREVALKEIQDQHADRSDSRARFLLEAEITGKLEHPGVVPVYGLGSYPDGRPFYAMRFIKGDSLKDAIERFHASRSRLPGGTFFGPARQAGPTFHSLAFRQLLGRFLDVCDAVAYAHSRGVLHRDLKPGNVMLGRYGETLVVDWGLAKLLGRSEERALRETTILTAGLASEASPTQTGQAVGTPQYMSPEQAAGKLDVLGPATDVYSLGATLYSVLTGRPPFSAAGKEGVGALLRKVEQGDFPPPRRVKPDVLRPLEAICLKAMSRSPEDRYASVEALAQDVQQWLAGEPVTAWPEPLTVKAGRWVRKNRVLAAAAAAAVVVALVLGTAGSVWLQQQKERQRQERLARQEKAAVQAKAGLTQLQELRKQYRFAAADTMLTQVRGWAEQVGDGELDATVEQAQADLDLARDLDDVRQKAATLMESKWDPRRARGDYEKVLAQHGLAVLAGDTDELVERIRASTVRENIVAALDDWAQSESDLARWQRLLQLANRADEPNPWRQAVREAAARRDKERLRQLANESEKGKPTAGVALLLALWTESEEATALLRGMQRERPDDFWLSFALGHHLGEQKKLQQAVEYYRVAVALRPYSAAPRNNLGNALADKGELDDAIASYRQAIRLDPKDAKAHTNLGTVLQAKGELDDAIASYRQAIRLDPRFAMAHGALGQALMQQGKFIEARDSLRRCVALLPPSHPQRGPALGLVRQCGQLLAAEEHLKAFLAGKGAPGDASTHVQMADLAQQPYKRLYVTAARLYRDAFASQPTLAGAQRYNAACAAALAGTGQGKDAAALTDAQRAQWRQQALDWLAADLDAYTTLAKKADGRPAVQKQLAHWLKDTDLASVRDEPGLAKLPEKERESWRKLWADVAALLKQVEPK